MDLFFISVIECNCIFGMISKNIFPLSLYNLSDRNMSCQKHLQLNFSNYRAKKIQTLCPISLHVTQQGLARALKLCMDKRAVFNDPSGAEISGS